MQVEISIKSMGTLTIEGRNNPDTHWVVLTIVVVELTHANSVNKYVYKQIRMYINNNIYMYAHVSTHIRFTVCISNLALKLTINYCFV